MRVILVLGAFQAGVMVANLVRVKVLAVELGPAGVGLLTLIEQIVLLAALAATLSLPYAAVKFLSLAHSRSRHSFVRTYIAFRRALTALSLAGMAALLLIALTASGIFGSEVAGERRSLLIAIAAIPLLNLLTLLIRALAASGRATAASAVTLGQAVGLALGASAGMLVAGPEGYFAGGAAGLAAALAAATLYLRRVERTGDSGEAVRSVAELRKHDGVLRFALVHSVIMVSTPAAFLIARYVVLGSGELEDLGLLAAAFAISQSLTLLLTPASALFLTPALNRGDLPAEKLRTALEFRRTMLYAIGAAMLPLLLFPRLALEVLFAPEFTPVAAYIYLFVVGEAIGLVSGIHQALLVGLDDFGVNVGYIVAGQIVLIGLVVALVPSIGVAGVGVALIANHALVAWLTSWRLRRRHGMSVLKGLRPYAPVAAGLAAVGAVVPSLPAGDLALTGAKVVLLAGLLAAGAYVYRSAAPVRSA